MRTIKSAQPIMRFALVKISYVYTFRYISTSSSETGVLMDSAISLKALQGTWGPTKKQKNTLNHLCVVRSDCKAQKRNEIIVKRKIKQNK